MIIKLGLAFLLDVLFGDPLWLYHPIRIIGQWISLLEKGLRRIFKKNRQGEGAAGFCLLILTVVPSFLLPWILLKAAGEIHPWLSFVLEVFWMYQILAMKSLRTESMKVFDGLMEKDLEKARKMLSWLVGRDTENLSEEEVIQADVETIAENTTDGVTAPIIFMAIGGAPLGFAYKAVNTLDSMVGYRNEKYRYFGTASARADDVVNFLPARISGLLMVLAAFIMGYDGKNAWQCFLRDRNKHLSPNSAQTESVCAGALGIQLGGTHDYFGKAVEKPTIGDKHRKPVYADIRRANALMAGTALLCLLCVELVLLILKFL